MIDWYSIVSLDLPAVTTATASAVTCALLGNYLVLRRLSLMGDAISHAVLPGIVLAFIFSGSRSSFPMFIGAAGAGILTAILIEFVRRYGRVESSAAMGVVFCIFFAFGILLIEQAAARAVDLDADCVLHGQLESIFWFPPKDLSTFFSWGTLRLIPEEVYVSLLVLLSTCLLVILLYKEFALASFDPELASSLGYSPQILHLILMAAVASAVVVSFEAVGSILVIAMLITPAATARLLTDRLATQILLSAIFALIASVGGYLFATLGPSIFFRTDIALNAAGMMAVTSGTVLFAIALCAPRYGILGRWVRRLVMSWEIRREDLLGKLYRLEEQGLSPESRVSLTSAADRFAAFLAKRSHEIEFDGERLKLLQAGRTRAESLVRAHRLWEAYLVTQGGYRPDHVHTRATELEHFTNQQLDERLTARLENVVVDPHGAPIPGAKAEWEE